MSIIDDQKTAFESLLTIVPDFSINGVVQTVYAFKEGDLQAIAASKGLQDMFIPSARISSGRKYLFSDSDATYEMEVSLKWHSPDSGAGVNSVSQYVDTAQIAIFATDKNTGVTTRRYFRADYSTGTVDWVRNAKQRWTHIPVTKNSPQNQQPPDGVASKTGRGSSPGASLQASRRFRSEMLIPAITQCNFFNNKKEVKQMAINYNDLFRRAVAFNEGECSDKCSDSELRKLCDDFLVMAKIANPTETEIAQFEQIVTIIFYYEAQDKIDPSVIVSSAALEIYNDVAKDFVE